MVMSVTAAGQAGEALLTLPRSTLGRGGRRGWSESFPVDLRPRPLVLVAPLIIIRGFRSGEAKLAFLYGDIDTAVPLPDGLLELLRENGDEPRAAAERRRWKVSVLITQAHPDSAEFATDRGKRELPAWTLTGPEVDGPFWVLDPTVASQRWTPPKPVCTAGVCRISVDRGHRDRPSADTLISMNNATSTSGSSQLPTSSGSNGPEAMRVSR
jgi:hypothetical protein